MNPDLLWRPEEHPWTRDSHVARFMRTRGLGSLAELRQASVHCYQWFWDEVLRDMGLEWTRRYTQVRDVSRGLAGTRWFVGGEINITHNCIDRHLRQGHGAETALICAAEGGRKITFSELADRVNFCVLALRAAGVQRGDCVAFAGPISVAAVVVLFAAFKMGARFAPLPADLDPAVLRERLAACDARVLFAAMSPTRRERGGDEGAAVGAAVASLSSLWRMVWVDRPDWEEFLASGGCLVPQRNRLGIVQQPALTCEVTQAEEPCLILHTAGATGRPKATVHTHAGCLAQMGKELRYAFDVRPGEPFLWLTGIDGVMGSWMLIGCLLYRTPVVLAGGELRRADAGHVGETCANHGVVTLGVSPADVRHWRHLTGVRAPGAFNLSKLRVLGASGEAWDDASCRWYYEHVGQRRCPILTLASATEIAGSYLQPYPLETIRISSCGGPALGLDLEAVDEEGKTVPRGVAGHLVCRQPVPSMTKTLIGAENRYPEAYFTRFRGTWSQDDWVRCDEDGQWFMLGREDEVLACNDRVFAAGEIENALLSQPGVTDAAAMVVRDRAQAPAWHACIVAPASASVTEPGLIRRVGEALGADCGLRHVWSVAALPRLRSGAVARAAIARALQGDARGDESGIENPEALDAIAALAHSQPA